MGHLQIFDSHLLSITPIAFAAMAILPPRLVELERRVLELKTKFTEHANGADLQNALWRADLDILRTELREVQLALRGQNQAIPRSGWFVAKCRSLRVMVWQLRTQVAVVFHQLRRRFELVLSFDPPGIITEDALMGTELQEV